MFKHEAVHKIWANQIRIQIWLRYDNRTGDLHEQLVDFYLDENVVKNLAMSLRNVYLFILKAFLSSLILVRTLSEQMIYCVGTMRTNKKQMSTFSANKTWSRVNVNLKVVGVLFVVKKYITELLH